MTDTNADYTVDLAQCAALYSGLLLLYIPRDQPLRDVLPVFDQAAAEYKRRVLEGDVNAKYIPVGAVPNRRHETHRLFQVSVSVRNFDNPRTPFEPSDCCPSPSAWIDYILSIERRRLIHYLQHQREYAVLIP